VAKRLEELSPPFATVTVRAEGPDEVVFHREPTAEELERLEKQHPGYVVKGRPEVAR
jgi:hypothetical protein